VLIVLLSGCAGVKPVAPSTLNISTNETISPNTTASNVSQNETPLPWLNRDVFSDASIAINVTVGQEFVIGYNWYNNLFAGFPTIFSSSGTVIILGQQATPLGQPSPATGTYWFLLKAVEVGTTNFTVQETTHLNVGVTDQKTFVINVNPALPQTVTVVSVASVEPINPGSTVVQITLKNTSSQPITSLNATLDLSKPVMVTPAATLFRPIVFTFPTPIAAGSTVSAKVTFTTSSGGGYNTGYYYPLVINGTTQDGHDFAYTQSVQIQ